MYLKIIDGQISRLNELPRTYIHDGYITFNPTKEIMGYEEYPEIEQEVGYSKYYGIVNGNIEIIREEIPQEVVEEIIEEIPTENEE